jgi:hypothetical protein
MGPPVKMFRKDPPREFVEGLLREWGFLGFSDLRWFSRDEIRMTTQETWLPELEAYYLPCKARRFIHNWSNSTILTLMRHVLHVHDYTLQKEERLYKGSKQMLYQIQPVRASLDLSGVSLQVDFT